jgi:uncharacterized membrane protein YhhN
MPRSTQVLVAYAALSVVHVLSRLLELGAVATVTKPMLMPLLAAYLVVASARPLPRLARLVLVALVFSWFGDALLLGSGDGFELAGLGGFLVAQVLYIVAFAPLVRSGQPGRPPLWALLYVLWGAVLMASLGADLGSLLLPALVYAVVICTMAIVASGVNRYTAVGAFFFVLSDSLNGLARLTEVLVLDVAIREALIMSTYTLAQGLIVHGVVVAQRRTPQPVPPAAPLAP